MKNARAFSNRGAAFKKLGRNDRAIADDNEAIRLDPAVPEYFGNRGLSHNHNGDYDLAIADFSAAIRIRPEAKFLTNRGDAYQFKHDYDHAIADYNAALKLNPRSDLAHNNLGAAYRSKGELDRAILHYEQALRLNPRNDAAMENLQAVRRDRGRLALVNPRSGPSFDCAAATRAVEKAICSDEDLMRLDRDLDAVYRSALAKLAGRKAAALRQDQRTFLATRDRMFGRPDYQLRKQMERRLAELQAMGR